MDGDSSQASELPPAAQTRTQHAPARRFAGIAESLGVAVASVGAGWAVNALSDASGLWAATIAGVVGICLFLALEQLRVFQDRSLGTVPRRRAVRVCVALAVAVALFITADFTSRRLPCWFGFANADLIFCDDFRSINTGWVSPGPSHGSATFTNDGLMAQADRGYAAWLTAPNDVAASDIRITASARFQTGGAGAWGVWCRGTEDGASRYEFTVTHAGVAYIKIGDEADIYQIPRFQVDQVNTIDATCRDIPGEAVELIMQVNGDALTIRRTTGSDNLLGPGDVGLHAATFGDVRAAIPSVLFEMFRVEHQPD